MRFAIVCQRMVEILAESGHTKRRKCAVRAQQAAYRLLSDLPDRIVRRLSRSKSYRSEGIDASRACVARYTLTVRVEQP
jgi:hypothetical protein